ncbi:tenascin-R-like isoform X2 [Apostichopus japonicus]
MVTYSLPSHRATTSLQCVFKIRVIDTESPRALHCPATVTASADEGQNYATGVTWTDPLFQDNVAVDEVESTHEKEDPFMIGYTEVTYTAEDEAGNKGKCIFNVTVLDTEVPVINDCPLDIIALSPGSTRSRAVEWKTPSPNDNSGHVEMTSQFHPGHRFQLGRTMVSYIARDQAQNEAVCTFGVFIKASVPENRIYVRSVTTTSIKLAWPETTDTRASSYLIYIWKVREREPMPYEHLYQVTDRRHAVATRTVQDLIPGEIYNIRIVVAGTSSGIFTQQRTLPSPPSSIQSDHVSLRPTSFVLKWQSGIGIFQRYHVIVRDASSLEVMLDRQLDQSHSMVMVTGLEPDTKYACAITTISGGRRGRQESDVVLVNVRTESLPPLQVEALRVTSSSLSVIFNFPPEESDVTAVDDVFETSQAVFLYESNVEAYADTAFPKNDGNTRFTFESLQPMINYTVKVIDNESGRSLQASFLTEPPEVRGLRAVFIDDTSIRISWDQINIPGIVYEIDLSPRPPQMEKLITTDLNECNLDNLITLETYIITLSSVYGNHRSSSISIQVVPGLDNSSTNTIDGSCTGAVTLYVLFLLTTLILTAYVFALFCWNLPACVLPPDMRKTINTENHYEDPVEQIIETKDTLPSFGSSFKEQLNGIVSRGANPLRFLSMRLNVYNTNSDKDDKDDKGYAKPVIISAKARTQSERVPRLKRSSSTSALYLNVRRNLKDSLLIEEDFENDSIESMRSNTESIIWC